MSHDLDQQAIAKRPTQKRALARFENVLAAAEELLVEEGMSGFSIPVLADRLGYTRGSVYAYFPSSHAIFNELSKRYLAELEKSYIESAVRLANLPWQKGIEAVVTQAVAFHNAHPAARLIILGGAVTDDTFRAQEITIKRLGDLGRKVLKAQGIKVPARSPDVTTLAVDIAMACFRRSVFEHGTIVRAYRDAAVKAMIAFLEPYVAEATAKAAKADG